jgi:hypothetical protein
MTTLRKATRKTLGRTASFALNLPCWTQGLQKLKVGGKGKPDLPAVDCLRAPWHPHSA